MRGPAVVVSCVVVVSTLIARGASADLRDTASRVAEQWKGAGAVVRRGDARFLAEDATITVAVPTGTEDRCTTVALIGARGISFHAKIVDADDADSSSDRSEGAASVAGVLEVTRCGGDELTRLSLTSDAGRGAIEIVVARSHASLPLLRVILPERTGGALPQPPEPGGLPPLPSPEARADIAEMRARRDGGRVAARDAWQAGADGAGEGRLMLEAGCHRVELFAVDPRTSRASRRFRLDLDAELRDDDETLISRDRTDAPDARLEACVGEAIAATVAFAGSPPSAPVVVTHLSWPIPDHLPLTWGRDTRARMAAAMLARHAAPPRQEAILLAQGPSGTTPVPMPVESGGCYIAVVALEHGHARGIGLRAVVGARSAADERGTSDEAAVVAFCARDHELVHLEVDARGVGVAWALAAFRLESAVWEPLR